MSEAAVRRMSIEEFLDWQTSQDQNWELDDGIPVLPLKSMTGASQRHDRVTVNIIRELANQLRRSPCRPSTDDIALVTGIRSIRRPDITVQCGDADPRSTTSVEPRVLIEVLSPSTVNYDRVKTLDEYKRLAAVMTVLLVDTEQPRITMHARDDSGSWVAQEMAGLDATVDLPSIGCRLLLADVYEGVHGT